MATKSLIEVTKIIDDAFKNIVNNDEYPMTKLFEEKSVLRTYKFTPKETKKIMNKYKCRVDIRAANILYRLEQYYRSKMGKPNKNNIPVPEQLRKRSISWALQQYRKKYQHYNERQEYRRICTAKNNAEKTVINRFNYFLLLNLHPLNGRIMSNENIENNENDLNKSQNLESSENEETNEYYFSYNLSELANITFSQPNSEPITSYSDFHSISIPTSTQEYSDPAQKPKP